MGCRAGCGAGPCTGGVRLFPVCCLEGEGNRAGSSTPRQAPGSHTLSAHRQHPSRLSPPRLLWEPSAARPPGKATGAPAGACPTSAPPDKAQAGRQSHPNVVNELIHESCCRTKGAQTAQGHVMFGVCFATLTFPQVPVARAGGGQGVVTEGSLRGQQHLVPPHPVPSSSAALGGDRRPGKV